ncbi:GNAT family N-acetyltransferase [Actinoplanes sp. CA-015351]|uniref:GNAT family N-acetyltransferase n=1 Tax=Actinoplanes sp. CA-015351 TaxID=3239897 RepID=UPI003D9725CE
MTLRIKRSDSVRTAAAIWARATARRDGQPASVESQLPGVRRRLAQGGVLHIAFRGEDAVGFTILVGAELVYLAVDPQAWGSGVAGALLTHVDDQARLAGISDLELWVIAGNERAIAVYERAGWTRTSDVTSGERRLVRKLTAD